MKRYRNMPPEPSEWKVDEYGRRYRGAGGIIEYAPTILTSHSGTVYLDDLPEINRRRAEREAEQLILIFNKNKTTSKCEQ